MGRTADYTLERGEIEIDVTVEYSVTPYYHATYDDPAEGGEIEIEAVTGPAGKIALTPEEDAALTRWLADYHADDPDEREYEPGDDYAHRY